MKSFVATTFVAATMAVSLNTEKATHWPCLAKPSAAQFDKIFAAVDDNNDKKIDAAEMMAVGHAVNHVVGDRASPAFKNMVYHEVKRVFKEHKFLTEAQAA